MEYSAKGHELANAFARAKHYMESPPKTKSKQGQSFMTIGGSMRFANGHDLRVLRCALGLLTHRLEGKNATNWLAANGVPRCELSGLEGMRAVKVWKILWLEKLVEEFSDDDKEYTFTYPF